MKIIDIMNRMEPDTSYSDAEILECASGIEFYDPRMQPEDTQIWWSLNYGAFMSRVKKIQLAKQTLSIHHEPIAIQRCSRCGDTNITGAIFTTNPASGMCDDCI